MPLRATIEVPASQTDAQAFHVTLRIANQSGNTISILNPDMGIPSPTMNWPWSNEVYQTSLLISFSYLTILVTDQAGSELPQQPVQTWATPVLRPQLELAPGDSFALEIPIGTFYQLESGRSYWITIEYGNRDSRVMVRTHAMVP